MKRIEWLLADMTLEEKLGQLTMLATGAAVTGPTSTQAVAEQVRAGIAGSVLNLVGRAAIEELQRVALEQSRLRIPLLFGLDVLHGYRTLFPIPLAEAGCFDPTLWLASAREAALEAAADGLAMTFAPMLDVARDPRWGRCAEGPGEDAWLGAAIARAKVSGFQGAQARLTLAAVAKHFLGYGAATAGRDYASVDLSERTLAEVYLPPFAAAVNAGVAAVMPGFHDWAGEPLTASGLMDGWLRRRLGFEGVIVSDYHAIAELLAHGVAGDLAEAAALALDAGVDIDMMSDAYRTGLPLALARGRVHLSQIDTAVRRVLALKERLGLFEDPYRRAHPPVHLDEPARHARRKLAREIAVRSLVLLSNPREVLPLGPVPGTLAVLGPLADARREMRGPWWGAAHPEDAVTVLEGLRRALPGHRVLHTPGVALEREDRADGATVSHDDAQAALDAALELVDRATTVILCLGEGAEMSGEAASRAHPGLPGAQEAFASAVLERARARRRAVVLVLFSGRPLIVPRLIECADATLAAFFPGCEAGAAIAAVLLGSASPSGRLAMSWPRAVGQIPVFYGARPTGRPSHALERFSSRYLDEAVAPQFVFGDGLGYGRCRLENLRLGAGTLAPGETLQVEVDVVHESGRSIEETVFLFIRRPLASRASPLLELRGFTKVQLAPGERATAALTLAAADLTVLDSALEPRWQAGPLEVLVGPRAERGSLLATTIEMRASA